MKSAELRVGNLIIDNEFPSIISEIIGISFTDVVITQYSDSLKLTDTKPIPLTEEWLLKMGGKKVNNLDWSIMFGGIEFYCRYNKFWYCSIGSVYLSDRIQFVHQVQNLYFSITNQELTMK
jgi:hypothetical protein